MEVLLFFVDAFFLLFSKLICLIVDSPLLQPSDRKRNRRNLKRVGTLAGVAAFIMVLTVLVFVTSASRKKLGKPAEKVMISKSQIFMICLNSTQIVLLTEVITPYNEF
jgi:hypothetical protein